MQAKALPSFLNPLTGVVMRTMLARSRDADRRFYYLNVLSLNEILGDVTELDLKFKELCEVEGDQDIVEALRGESTAAVNPASHRL